MGPADNILLLTLSWPSALVWLGRRSFTVSVWPHIAAKWSPVLPSCVPNKRCKKIVITLSCYGMWPEIQFLHQHIIIMMSYTPPHTRLH